MTAWLLRQGHFVNQKRVRRLMRTMGRGSKCWSSKPKLGCDRPVFLCDYPAPLASLARLKDDDPSVGERFDLYIGGLEIANGFSELTDADEQRKRFEDVPKKRAAKNWTRYDMPEKFLQSLDDLPPCAGVALGIDRLVMLCAGADRIDEVVAFTPEEL